MDWKEGMEPQHDDDDDDEGSMREEELVEEDAVLRDYQSGVEEVPYSSCSDDNTGPSNKRKERSKQREFDTSYFGKEPYWNADGQVVLEKDMIFIDVFSSRAEVRDYTIETDFKDCEGQK